MRAILSLRDISTMRGFSIAVTGDEEGEEGENGKKGIEVENWGREISCPGSPQLPH
jgi:hypothetical protein